MGVTTGGIWHGTSIKTPNFEFGHMNIYCMWTVRIPSINSVNKVSSQTQTMIKLSVATCLYCTSVTGTSNSAPNGSLSRSASVILLNRAARNPGREGDWSMDECEVNVPSRISRPWSWSRHLQAWLSLGPHARVATIAHRDGRDTPHGNGIALILALSRYSASRTSHAILHVLAASSRLRLAGIIFPLTYLSPCRKGAPNLVSMVIVGRHRHWETQRSKQQTSRRCRTFF